MKVLIAGTSHAAGLRHAQLAYPDIAKQVGDIFYYVTAGGTGPYFSIDEEGFLKIDGLPSNSSVPYAIPESTKNEKLASFDIVVFSALGATVGVSNPKTTATHPGVLHRFSPKQNDVTNTLISEACCKAIVDEEFKRQHGVKFLEEISRRGTRIIIQPQPYFSEEVMTRNDWGMRVLYEASIEAHHFYSRLRMEAFQSLCSRTGARLLEYPNSAWREKGFTPKEFMHEDMIHMNAEYGRLVLQQITEALKEI